MKIDIITTATIRPKLLEQTYSSFVENLLYPTNQYHLILNIDPIGDSKYTSEDVLLVAKNFFPNITCNIPAEPNLSKAVIWCWENIANSFVFFLEDDWLLNKDVGGIDVLLDILKAYPRLASIGFHRVGKEKMLAELVKGEWGSKEALERKFAYLTRISLNPVLIRSAFLKAAVPFMKDDVKPEVQIRVPIHPKIKKLKGQWKYGTYVGMGFEPLIEDTGRSWILKSGWKKTREDRFLYWKKTNV